MLEARSFAQIDTTRSSEPSQMLCEVYFCAMVYRQPASAGSNFSYQQQIVRVTRRYSVCVCVSLSSFYTLQYTSGRCISVGVRLLLSVVTRSFKHEPSLYQHSEVILQPRKLKFLGNHITRVIRNLSLAGLLDLSTQYRRNQSIKLIRVNRTEILTN
ncbi:Hypothetical_protein [Hexamita inflata]|uniref:Hypothetical_protein n=1 Tax=Hexamita inflata TaxID=28002 RepID=A0AA86PQG6_9EUKA|nr:Hypothetical protein HINF_LOCUS26902 [Hexamita inflata]